MPGDRTRRCDACGRDVHDLSLLTEEEARALFERGDRVCARVLRDATGAVQFRAAVAAVALAASACSAPVAGAPQAKTVHLEDLGDMIPDTADRCPDPPDDDPSTGCPTADAGLGRD